MLVYIQHLSSLYLYRLGVSLTIIAVFLVGRASSHLTGVGGAVVRVGPGAVVEALLTLSVLVVRALPGGRGWWGRGLVARWGAGCGPSKGRLPALVHHGLFARGLGGGRRGGGVAAVVLVVGAVAAGPWGPPYGAG